MLRDRIFKRSLQIIHLLILSAAVFTTSYAASEQPIHHRTPPDLSDHNIQQFKVGVRPKRRGGMRLESEVFKEGRVLTHVYGLGGAGISLSWGCAYKAIEEMQWFVRDRDVNEPVAIMGAGVIGLSIAHILADKGYKKITVYAEAFSPNTTSDLAGGIWGPSGIEEGESAVARDQFKNILLLSHQKFMELATAEHPEFDGVQVIDAYNVDDDKPGVGDISALEGGYTGHAGSCCI